MEQKSTTVQMDQKEVYLLSGLFQRGALIGISDPFPGYLAEEISAELSHVIQTLVEKKYLQEQPEGGMRMQPGIAVLMDVLLSSECVYSASCMLENGLPGHSFLHRCGDRWLEQKTLPDGHIALTPLNNAAEAAACLVNHFHLPDLPAAAGESLSVPASLMEEASRLAKDGKKDEAVGILKQGDVDPQTAALLASALADPQGMGTLLTILRGAREMAYGNGLSWLLGQDGAWMIDSDQVSASLVTLTPASTRQMNERIKTLLVGQPVA